MKPIAKIETSYPEKFAIPRQGGMNPYARGVISFLEDHYVHGLQGLENYSHIWLLWLFSDNKNKRNSMKVSPPRLEEKWGCFATRSPHRPNPIAMSCVKLDRIDQGKLYVSGLDLLSRTPILDIKPYIPEYDHVPEAQSELPTRPRIDFDVVFAKDALNDLECLPPISLNYSKYELKDFLIANFQMDPRPRIYKENHYREIYKAKVLNLDVHFRAEETVLTILRILSI